MRYSSMILISLFLFFSNVAVITAQEEVSIRPVVSEAEEGLDLQSVAELFKDSENLEEFERALNDPQVGINNLDLDENLDVDYIRVVDETDGDVHYIILQVPLGYEDYQDVAVIEVVKVDDDNCEMEIRGDEEIYGPDYYYSPSIVHIHTWPIILHLYHPGYRPYRSQYLWGAYPLWWKPYRPVKVFVYDTRVAKYRTRPTFVFTKTRAIKSVHKVKYVPTRSKIIKTRSFRNKHSITKPGTGKVTKERTEKKKSGITKSSKKVIKGGKDPVTKTRK